MSPLDHYCRLRLICPLALAVALWCVGATTACGPDNTEVLVAPLVAAPAATVTTSPDPGFIGVVIAGESADLEPKSEGRIEELSVRAGDEVHAGVRLARLDVRAALHELGIVRAALAEARRRYARRRQLARVDSGAVTDEELDSAHRELVQQREQVAKLSEAVAEADLRAPFDGTVAETYLSAGARAGPGKPVVRLVRPGEPRLRFAIPEDRRATVAVGDRVSVRVGPSAIALFGRVSGLAPEVDSASRLIYAAAALEPRQNGGAPGEPLTTGLIARVFVDRTLTAPSERKPEVR